MSTQKTDYLIVGAGAMGIAFADELFTNDPNLTLTIVDKRPTFGGHWNDDYDFVRLHQPAAFYGVNSLPLGKGGTDLSSKEEILEYYDTIRQKFESSKRVEFLGEHQYLGNQKVCKVGEPDRFIQYEVRKKVVDARYMNVQIPATHAPKFEVDAAATVLPINDLVHQHAKWENFCVVGGGKTGIDAVLFLLGQGVAPNNIQWIVPNDAWIFNRSHIQIGKVTKEIVTHAELMSRATEADEVFLEMEKRGGILRLDKNVLPTKWRCATVSTSELEKLKTVQNVIRKGRVQRITTTEVQLEKGNISFPESTLFVNCTANALSKKEAKPIFSKNLVTLQSVYFCQQVFSAALLGRLELSNITDEEKNKIKPVLHPELKEDWPHVLLITLRNLLLFNRIAPLWLFKARLNFMSHESFLQFLHYNTRALLIYSPLKKAVAKMSKHVVLANVTQRDKTINAPYVTDRATV